MIIQLFGGTHMDEAHMNEAHMNESWHTHKQ